MLKNQNNRKMISIGTISFYVLNLLRLRRRQIFFKDFQGREAKAEKQPKSQFKKNRGQEPPSGHTWS